MILTRNTPQRKDGISLSLQLGKAAEHLVCFKLIMQGYNAMLSGPGMPHDILIDLGSGIFKRVQVKSTTKMLQARQDRNGKNRFSLLYRFAIRSGKRGDRRIDANNCDLFAFVALDRQLVSFMKHNEVALPNGKCRTLIEMKTRQVDNSRKSPTGPNPEKLGRFMEDYALFVP